VEIDRDLVNRLPEQVRGEAARHVAAGDHGSLVSLLDDYLAGGHRPYPAVLLCVALARTWWATEVMVDRMIPFAELALVHVAAARQAGASPRDADPVERFVRAMLDGERKRRQQLDETVAEQLTTRAHDEWDAGRPGEAAKLFQEAARQGGHGAFNHDIRAALCLAEAGRFEEARPVLEQSLVYDWAAAGIWNDRHMTERAAMELLRHAAGVGIDEFDRVWDRTIASAERRAQPFPSNYRIQDELLDLTMRLGLPAHTRQVLDRVRARTSRLDAATRAKVQAAEAYLAS
jgi:hypothetical protein